MTKKNAIIFLTTSILSCNILVAEPIENNANQQPSTPIVAPKSSPEIEDKDLPISKEEFLGDIYNLPHAMRYEKMINSEGNPIITGGLAAQILCDYINQPPIFLRGTVSCEDPYIGRLVLEGIWSDENTKSTEKLTVAQWEKLLLRTNEYLINPMFKTEGLEVYGTTLKKQILKWRKDEKKVPTFSKVPIGKIKKDSSTLIYENKTYPLYNILYTTYISVEDIRRMGQNVDVTKDKIYINTSIIQPSKPAISKVHEKQAFLNPQKTYVGNLETYSLKVENDVLIPVKTLQNYYNIVNEGNKWIVKSPIVSTSDYIQINEGKLTNISDQILNVQGLMLFWNGEKIVSEPLKIMALAPTETYSIPRTLYDLDQHSIYLTTMLNGINGDNTNIKVSNQYAQINEVIYKRYETVLKEQQTRVAPKTLEELFPPSIIMGTMKYNKGGLKKGEKVELHMAEEGKYFIVKKNKQSIQVPWGSISIPADFIAEKKQAETSQVEAYINSKNFSSKTNYLVWTDLYRQRTYIFKGKMNNWKLHKNFLCSTGRNKTPTPRGEYMLQNHVPYFGTNKGYRCKNAVQIYGDYLYHSIIFDVTGTYLLEGKGVLGRRASQGCIRFLEEESKWFYRNLPLGTKVWIN